MYKLGVENYKSPLGGYVKLKKRKRNGRAYQKTNYSGAP